MRLNRRNRLWVPEAPHLITRPFKELVLAPIHVGIKGFFAVDLIDARTQKIRQHLEFENLITDAGLNAIGGTRNIGASNTFMAVGTGNTAPANSDTALVAEVLTGGRTSANGGFADVFTQGPASAYWSLKRTFLFDVGQGNGNLTELGTFNVSTAGTMWARQLFKDGTGTPTTVIKTSSDQLRVTYEWRIYSPADVTSSVTISAVSYAYTTRAIQIDTARVWGRDVSFGPLTDFGSGNNLTTKTAEPNTLIAQTGATPPASDAASTNTDAAYTNGNFFRDTTSVYVAGGNNYATGIGQLQSNFWGSVSGVPFQTIFGTTKLPKDNTKQLTLIQRLSWGRWP